MDAETRRAIGALTRRMLVLETKLNIQQKEDRNLDKEIAAVENGIPPDFTTDISDIEQRLDDLEALP